MLVFWINVGWYVLVVNVVGWSFVEWIDVGIVLVNVIVLMLGVVISGIVMFGLVVVYDWIKLVVVDVYVVSCIGIGVIVLV